MKYDLKAMFIFANVVEQGSMYKASKKLNITSSAISQHITKLEQKLKIKLLHRHTRQLILTEAGSIFYASAKHILLNVEDAYNNIEQIRDQSIGTLRISLVNGLINTDFTKILLTIMQNNPNIDLYLFFDDSLVNLLDNKIDLAIRIGALAIDNQNLIVRKLLSGRMILCANPIYLAKTPKIDHPQDLISNHNFISSTVRDFLFNLELKNKTNNETIHITPKKINIFSNNMLSIRDLTLHGYGISLQHYYEVANFLKNGELIEILPDWHVVSDVDIYVVTTQRSQSYKIKYVLQLLKNSFK